MSRDNNDVNQLSDKAFERVATTFFGLAILGFIVSLVLYILFTNKLEDSDTKDLLSSVNIEIISWLVIYIFSFLLYRPFQLILRSLKIGQDSRYQKRSRAIYTLIVDMIDNGNENLTRDVLINLSRLDALTRKDMFLLADHFEQHQKRHHRKNQQP